MQIQRDIDLSAFTTLAAPARAAHFVEIHHSEELVSVLSDPRFKTVPRLILGGGSNIVLSGDFPGLVIKLGLGGIECREEGDLRLLSVAAGENWDALVRYCLAKGYYGLENLIAIPGSVGAAPIQNIGAYGVELSRVLTAVSGFNIEQGCWQRLRVEECELSYRSSIFKTKLADKFVITGIELALTIEPRVELGYGALAEALPPERHITPALVAETVDALRSSKLPDYRREPNVGSFFKNPIVSEEQASKLRQQYPELVSWPMPDGCVKLAAAWLVDQLGWKGHRRGGVGVHPRQAIVLVNYLGETGKEILHLAAAIQADVLASFGVTLEIEPRIY